MNAESDLVLVAYLLYQIIIPIEMALLGFIVGLVPLIVQRTSQRPPSSKLGESLWRGLRGFVVLYLVVLSVALIGVVLHGQIDFPQPRGSEVNWLTVSANLTFEYSLFVFMPSIVYIYALIIGFSKLDQRQGKETLL